MQALLDQEQRLKAALAIKDTYFWMTEGTKTEDNQDPIPFKPFPQLPYLRPLLDVMDREPIVFVEKSRTMMMSWTASAWAAHKAFTNPATCVIFMSQDEARAVHDIQCCKTLWEQSLPLLKEQWPLSKPLEKQPYDELRLASGSRLIGIPGNPDKIRSEHPSIVVIDEAAHLIEGERAYNVAAATRCPHLIALTSVNPGWFRDATFSAVSCDWPEY